MNKREEAILEDVIEACMSIMKAIKGYKPPASGAALMITMAIVAQEDGRSREQLMASISRMLYQNWSIFTRDNLEQSIEVINQRKKKRMN
jgi:orotate phosphoribosyltransferase